MIGTIGQREAASFELKWKSDVVDGLKKRSKELSFNPTVVFKSITVEQKGRFDVFLEMFSGVLRSFLYM